MSTSQECTNAIFMAKIVIPDEPSKSQKLDMEHPVCTLYTEKKGGGGGNTSLF